MPNWATNVLSIEGDNDKIAEFISKVKTDEQAYPHIMQNLLPCPQELTDTVSGHIPETSPDYAEWMQKKASNMEKYGHQDWYDWQIANWGVKWGDSETELVAVSDRRAEYRFETPWSPPIAGFDAISEMFPELTFVLRYYDMGMGFAGCAGFHNGDMEDLSTENIRTPLDGLDESEDPEDFWNEVYEAYEDACTSCELFIRNSMKLPSPTQPILPN